ncbi:MAG: hypothetical protein ACR2GB_03630 [Nocardioidaceae bacterium]
MCTVPPAARVSCWLNAWLAGRESTDDVISAVASDGTSVSFTGWGSHDILSTALLLGELRRAGVARVSVAWPTPGHLLGLGGPSRFNADALEAGQAVLLHGAGLGLIPSRAGDVTWWRAQAATEPSYLPDVASADRELRSALQDAALQLAELDVASWGPDVADAVMNLQTPARLDSVLSLPSSKVTRMTVSALRCASIVRLAARDQGGAATGNEMAARLEALRPLERAAHAAVVAACSTIDGR